VRATAVGDAITGAGVGVGLGLGLGVGVGTGVGVAVGLGVGVAVGLGAGVGVELDCGVALGCGLVDGKPETTTPNVAVAALVLSPTSIVLVPFEIAFTVKVAVSPPALATRRTRELPVSVGGVTVATAVFDESAEKGPEYPGSLTLNCALVAPPEIESVVAPPGRTSASFRCGVNTGEPDPDPQPLSPATNATIATAENKLRDMGPSPAGLTSHHRLANFCFVPLEDKAYSCRWRTVFRSHPV
jgi:hypothetical protein